MAIAENSSGQMEMVVISRKNSKVLSSKDNGFTWTPIAGDGLGKSEAHRIVYYEVPSTGEKRFIIGADEGLWQYLPDTGVVTRLDAGLDLADLYIVDLAAPEPGFDGPVVAVTEQGKIFFLDEINQIWEKKGDVGLVDLNGVAAVTPHYDRNGLADEDHTVMVSVRGILVTSLDNGSTWVVHPDFSVQAIDIHEFRISAIELDLDYQNTGMILMGRGRRDDTSLFESEGELYRSTDSGVSFVNVQPTGTPQMSSGVYALINAGIGPDGNNHYYAGVFRYPAHEDIEAGMEVLGVLHSIDGGLTWTDHGNYQDFIQEFSANERTAVIRNYRRLMGFAVSPNFLTDGTLWFARAEGLYTSQNAGVRWGKRRIRPAQQVRGISAGYNEVGEVVAFGSTYGSGLFEFNHDTGAKDTLLGEGLLYYGCLRSSPNQPLDGLVFAGGQRDLGIYFDEPNPVSLQGWYFVNAIREALDGNTGYVRTVALGPGFGGPNLPGSSQVVGWSSRFENTPLGENRLTLDGLTNVHTINGVFGLPLQRAPHMHSMAFAQTFDKDLLPRELDFYGCSTSQEQVYHLLNVGTPTTPIFEWDLLDFNLDNPPVVIEADPDFSRPGNAKLWVMGEDSLFELVDQSDNWSNFTINTYPGIDDYLIKDMVLGPDMLLEPTVFVVTWGGGAFKLDLTSPNPTWQQIGSNFPNSWGDVISLSPNYQNDHLVFVGGQFGLFYCEDLPGADWTAVNNEVFLDGANTSFEFYSPQDPSNPDITRQWGWGIFLREDLPSTTLLQVDVYGESIIFGLNPQDYFEVNLNVGSKATVHSIAGPLTGDIHVIAWETISGSSANPVFDQVFDMSNPFLTNRLLEVPVPIAGIYTIRVKAQATMPQSKLIVVDGVSATL